MTDVSDTRDPEELSLAVTAGTGVPDAMVAYAIEKLTHLAGHEAAPILFGEIKLDLEANPAVERPARAEAVLDVNGDPVRAHVAAHDLPEAIDLLEDRLARRLERHRRRRTDRARRLHHHEDHEWRHGDPPAHRPAWYERPADERRLVRRKSFSVGEMTCDEAADALDLLGHDFLLFANLATGADAVLFYADDEVAGSRLELMDASGRADAVGDQTVAPVVLSHHGVPTCTPAEAAEQLGVDVIPFVFHLDPSTGRGSVVYRRYDGHYGCITPA